MCKLIRVVRTLPRTAYGKRARDPRLRAELDRHVPVPAHIVVDQDNVAIVDPRKRRDQLRPGMLLDMSSIF